MIYFLRNPQTGFIKIGTTSNIHLRLSQLIREYGDLELVGVMDGDRRQEAFLHKFFAGIRVFDTKGIEWFHATVGLLDYVKVNTHLRLPPTRPAPVNTASIPKLKHRLIELMAKRQEQTGKRITIVSIAASAGVSKQTLHHWIKGISRFDADTVAKLCVYFDCELHELLYVEKEPPESVPQG